MVMSALRDSSNRVVDFTGHPDDAITHILGDGGLVGGADSSPGCVPLACFGRSPTR